MHATCTHGFATGGQSCAFTHDPGAPVDEDDDDEALDELDDAPPLPPPPGPPDVPVVELSIEAEHAPASAGPTSARAA